MNKILQEYINFYNMTDITVTELNDNQIQLSTEKGTQTVTYDPEHNRIIEPDRIMRLPSMVTDAEETLERIQGLTENRDKLTFLWIKDNTIEENLSHTGDCGSFKEWLSHSNLYTEVKEATLNCLHYEEDLHIYTAVYVQQ